MKTVPSLCSVLEGQLPQAAATSLTTRVVTGKAPPARPAAVACAVWLGLLRPRGWK